MSYSIAYVCLLQKSMTSLTTADLPLSLGFLRFWHFLFFVIFSCVGLMQFSSFCDGKNAIFTVWKCILNYNPTHSIECIDRKVMGHNFQTLENHLLSHRKWTYLVEVRKVRWPIRTRQNLLFTGQNLHFTAQNLLFTG